MVQKFDRPVLSADERAYLRGAADPLAKARRTLEDLQRIGINVEADLAQVDMVEQIRAGLIDQFGKNRPRTV